MNSDISGLNGSMMNEMKALALLSVLICGTVDRALAENFSRTARSGEAALMHTYAAWTKDCLPHHGVVKVVTRPKHGKLVPRQAGIVATRGRHASNAHCLPLKVNGFQVYYTPGRAFRGTDSFTIEVTWGRLSEMDHYTVLVE